LLLRGLGSQPARASAGLKHLVFAWQFNTDGEPNVLAGQLSSKGLGIIMKTHDGVEWMSKYDKSRYAVSGPDQVKVLADYFENAGVPFHAWCVIHGNNPMKEAQMAADVLAAGARSIYLDLEPGSGFWAGTAADATAFGNELRRLQPNAEIVLSIDPRPWMVTRLPMKEFTAFSDAIAPQQYWRTFNTQANYDRFAQTGFPVPPEGTTPEFLLAVSDVVLKPYGLPLIQTGQGQTSDLEEWLRFTNGALGAGGNIVSVWRYGVTSDKVLSVLRDIAPRQPVSNSLVVASDGGVHVVQSGETMSGIAALYGVDMNAMAQLNGINDPAYIYVGQELKIPSGGVLTATAADTHAGELSASTGGGSSSGGGTYTVQAGDTLSAIAAKHGTTVDAIAKASGLSDPNVLSIGQVLTLP
jgi:LysM repeat protein